ncbi:N-acetyltransferase [Xenophilus sp. Marseille-Q4582]|uniref:N-acetyltransferase n=1 Tax=Xenophilus sp. Marseille-Q4582 TaxID=2866600 RepID=UPI001CE3DBEF|nr:N-acetyltransferase [Xenophilus sp. Marseille-Q4582]
MAATVFHAAGATGGRRARARAQRSAPALPVMRLAAALRALAARAHPHLTELRIDVGAPPPSVEAELDALQQRFEARVRAHCTCLGLPLGGLRAWHREADGEHHVYIECPVARRLVGHVVFNRLIEIHRSLDPHVRSPHTRIAPAYQGRGVASTVYRWALDAGFSLVSGARQSPGAHALWHALGRHYHLSYVQLVRKELRLLGPQAAPALREGLDTRLMLFGVPARR